ncbi:MAG: NAD(+) synthase [Alphaproteobacteria bacterium]|nr:NAD(+) synthase [Alphaproteobacteria bacterium]
MNVVVVTMNPIAGAVQHNAQKITHYIEQHPHVDMMVFPEMSLCGYMINDLVAHPAFAQTCQAALAQLAAATEGCSVTVVVGAPEWERSVSTTEAGKDARRGNAPAHAAIPFDRVYNAAYVLQGGKVHAVIRKQKRPNSGVFDEIRNFAKGMPQGPIRVKDTRVGLLVCEDMWHSDPGETLVESGAECLVCLNASPWFEGQPDNRRGHASMLARRHGVPLLYVNLLGGMDDEVFDGGAFAVDAEGVVQWAMPAFEEQACGFDFPDMRAISMANTRNSPKAPPSPVVRTEPTLLQAGSPVAPKSLVGDETDSDDGLDFLYRILMLGIRDYTRKSGITQTLVGLSGGIDSALVLCLAADALRGGAEHKQAGEAGDRDGERGAGRDAGKDAPLEASPSEVSPLEASLTPPVQAVYMPSEFSAAISGEDAAALAAALSVPYREIPIAAMVQQMEDDMNKSGLGLRPALGNRPSHASSVPHENLQARIRGTILMTMANASAGMVLATSNKSETAMGYATLYGDMCGGYSPLKDVYKTKVQALCAWRNDPARCWLAPIAPIPPRILTRPPSAELRPNQQDTDSLPPYPALDAVLEHLIERRTPLDQLKTMLPPSIDHAMLDRIWRTLMTTEHKRRQAAPGPKVTGCAFGRDRRYPLINQFAISSGAA